MAIAAFNILLFLSSGFIAYQDLKDRMVSLWLLLIYLVNMLVYVCLHNGVWVLLENTISTLVYFGICFFCIFIYFMAREKKIPVIIDAKIGKADLLVFLAIGITLPLMSLLLFFTVAFILSLVFALFFLKDKRSVPLAGILVLLHFFYSTCNQLFNTGWN